MYNGLTAEVRGALLATGYRLAAWWPGESIWICESRRGRERRMGHWPESRRLSARQGGRAALGARLGIQCVHPLLARPFRAGDGNDAPLVSPGRWPGLWWPAPLGLGEVADRLEQGSAPGGQDKFGPTLDFSGVPTSTC